VLQDFFPPPSEPVPAFDEVERPYFHFLPPLPGVAERARELDLPVDGAPTPRDSEVMRKGDQVTYRVT
jgi:hypothetical protein